MAESKFCQWFSVSEFDINTNTLCFPRSQNHEKIQFESTNFIQVEGNESFQLFVVLPLFASVRYSRSLQENARGAFQIGRQVSVPESDLRQRWDRRFCRAFGRYVHVILIQAAVLQRYVQDCK